MALLPLREVARQVVVMTVCQAVVLLLLGAGSVAPPAQTSAGPPSDCAAPFAFYENIAQLNFFFAPCAIGAVSLAAAAAWNPAAAGGGSGGGLGAAAGATTPARVRALAMVAGALSATSAALAMAASLYVLQVRSAVLACLSAPTRAAAYAVYVLLGLVVAVVYGDLARVVSTAE